MPLLPDHYLLDTWHTVTMSFCTNNISIICVISGSLLSPSLMGFVSSGFLHAWQFFFIGCQTFWVFTLLHMQNICIPIFLYFVLGDSYTETVLETRNFGAFSPGLMLLSYWSNTFLTFLSSALWELQSFPLWQARTQTINRFVWTSVIIPSAPFRWFFLQPQ